MRSADDIGGIQAETPQRGGGKARLIPLVANEDDPASALGKLGVTVAAIRVESPLEDIALDHDGARNDAIRPELALGTDVDQDSALISQIVGSLSGYAIKLIPRGAKSASTVVGAPKSVAMCRRN